MNTVILIAVPLLAAFIGYKMKPDAKTTFGGLGIGLLFDVLIYFAL